MRKINVRNQIDAVVAACELRHDGYEDRTKAGDKVAMHASYTIGRLSFEAIDKIILDGVGEGIASCLTVRLDKHYLNAWVRYRCAQIEVALGIPHSAETQAAIDAHDAIPAAVWEAYCATFKVEPVARLPAAEACTS